MRKHKTFAYYIINKSINTKGIDTSPIATSKTLGKLW